MEFKWRRHNDGYVLISIYTDKILQEYKIDLISVSPDLGMKGRFTAKILIFKALSELTDVHEKIKAAGLTRRYTWGDSKRTGVLFYEDGFETIEEAQGVLEHFIINFTGES